MYAFVSAFLAIEPRQHPYRSLRSGEYGEIYPTGHHPPFFHPSSYGPEDDYYRNSAWQDNHHSQSLAPSRMIHVFYGWSKSMMSEATKAIKPILLFIVFFVFVLKVATIPIAFVIFKMVALSFAVMGKWAIILGLANIVKIVSKLFRPHTQMMPVNIHMPGFGNMTNGLPGVNRPGGIPGNRPQTTTQEPPLTAGGGGDDDGGDGGDGGDDTLFVV